MQPTRPWPLLAVAAVCAVLAWLVVSATFANLPPLPWTAVPALLLVAIGETLIGRNLRARLLGQTGARPGGQPSGRPGVKPVQPMAVPKVVALAKASSTAAAAFGGLAGGFAIYAARSLGKPVPRHDALTAVVTVAAAIILAVAALYLEHSCRAPEPPDQDLPQANGQSGRQP